MDGVLWTYVQKAYTLGQDDDADIGDDPFGDLRPAMPDNLPELLEVAPLRPLNRPGAALGVSSLLLRLHHVGGKG